MIAFLTNYFRYDTMSSWNACTSYANNVKVHRVIPSELRDKVYDLLETEGFYDDLRQPINDFNEEHNYNYQIGFNGRSSEYLVLYNGEKKKSEYKSYCTKCGQKNFKSIVENGNKCGRCGENARIDHTFWQVYTMPGKTIDGNADFEEWSMGELKDRVKLIQEFDQTCDDVVGTAIYMANNGEVVKESYVVVKTHKVYKENEILNEK